MPGHAGVAPLEYGSYACRTLHRGGGDDTGTFTETGDT